MDDALFRTRQLLSDLYLPARERAQMAFPDAAIVREDSHADPVLQQNERFLQVLWNEKCCGAALRTSEGARVGVRSAGTWNPAAGPDFSDAVLTVGDRLTRGAVEVHRREADWFAHGHHHDSAYREVCLHVVGVRGRRPAHTDDGRVPPVLCLSDCLEGPLADSVSNTVADYPYGFRVPPGRCALQWLERSDEAFGQLLEAAGLSRFREKTRVHLEAIERRGQDQAFYEGFFDALGYRSNRIPFRELAGCATLDRLRRAGSEPDCVALLYGTAGFLPDPSSAVRSAADRQAARRLWDRWWRYGASPIRSPWHWNGVRPANRPERRLAAGTLLLMRTRFAPGKRLREEAGTASRPEELLDAVERFFSVREGAPEAWLPHVSPTVERRALLGKRRVQDITANVALPHLAACGALEQNAELAEVAESAFLHLPKLQTNRSLLEVTNRLFLPESRARQVVRRACHQQGLLAIHRDFCLALGTDCLRCPLADQATCGKGGEAG